MVNQAKMARYRHLVFHILEFLQKHQLYPDEQILKFKIELLNKTNKSLHHTEDAPQDIIIYGGRAAPLVTFLLNPNVVQELRGDKQYNLQMLKERYQVTRLNVGITQHKLVPEETVTVIDSRCGEKISVYK
uniref:Eukaryotic translation initiation factor 3 subunit E N-terminal domain-containing protein n=1 Tax=Brassica oleracea var. oleracea TaxID=109376 RepID=A0A0D3CQK0_BRAOL